VVGSETVLPRDVTGGGVSLRKIQLLARAHVDGLVKDPH